MSDTLVVQFRDVYVMPKGVPESANIASMFQRYQQYLLLQARTQIGRRLRGKIDPTDIVQETFLEAHRQFTHFRGRTEGEFLAWLRRILAGKLALTLRHYLGTRGRDVRLERALSASADAFDRGLAAATPFHAATHRETALLLAQAIEKLPADYREALVLRHVENLGWPEIATRMGRSPDAAQKLLARARHRLRAEMEHVM